MIDRFISSVVLIALSASASAHNGQLAPQRLSAWDIACAQAASKAVQVKLTNAGIIDQTKVLNEQTQINLLVKQPDGTNAFKLIYHIVLHDRSGKVLPLILATDARDGECPYQDDRAYIVSKEL